MATKFKASDFSRGDYKFISKREKKEFKQFIDKLSPSKKKKKHKPRPKIKVDRMAVLAADIKGTGYPAFLQSTYWAKVRKLVFVRDKSQCTICGGKENLQVHHNTYKHHYSEHLHLEDLMTICKPCHTEHHKAQD